MAILFNRNLQVKWVSFGFHYQANTFTLNSSSSGNATSTWAVTLFPGVQPTADTITSSWTSYNTTFLIHWQSIALITFGITNASVPKTVQLNGATSSVNADNTGTATWGILWPTNPAKATIQGSSLPSTRFIVVPVSLTTGNGTVRLISTALSSGLPYTITDFYLSTGGGIA